MKTIIKNKRSYRTKIGRPYKIKEDKSSGSQQPEGGSDSGGSGDRSSASDDDAENQYTNSDESEGENDTSAAVSAGTKRKAIGSAGKGKQRKVWIYTHNLRFFHS